MTAKDYKWLPIAKMATNGYQTGYQWLPMATDGYPWLQTTTKLITNNGYQTLESPQVCVLID